MRKGIGEDGKVVAVIGDGALTGGVAYEALHHAGGLETPMVIVLNDNGMSISPNVGALSHYFHRFRLNPRLYHAREDVEERLTQAAARARPRGSSGSAPRSRRRSRPTAAPGLLFEELDLAYMGVIDGHDVAALRWALGQAFEAERPVVVHIHTVKGKGFEPAEEGGLEGMEKWHAAKPGSIVDRRPAPEDKPKPSRSASRTRPERSPPRSSRSRPPSPRRRLHVGLRRRAGRGGEARQARDRDHRRDGGGDGPQQARDEVPEQYYDVGIAEQDAVLFAVRASRSRAPSRSARSTRPSCSARFDQIVHDVCLQKLNVVFAMDRAGLVGDDGPTHHGAFDISYFRALPNVVLMAPRDEAMLVHMLRTALAHDDGPIAFRYPRGAAEGVAAARARRREIEIGKGELLREGERVALLGYG